MISEELIPSTTTNQSTSDSAVQPAPSQPQAVRQWHGLARTIVESRPGLAERLQTDPQAHLELVGLAASAKAETAVLLSGAVRSARGAGCTWNQIGDVLGITRQAAQQQYGDDTHQGSLSGVGARRQAAQQAHGDDSDQDFSPAGPAEVMTLAPLTAFNEMPVLDRAGEYGWHSVAYGPFFHRVERDARRWQHARTLLGARPGGDGWEPVGSGWAWWSYWARPTDEPARSGNPSVAELVENRILR